MSENFNQDPPYGTPPPYGDAFPPGGPYPYGSPPPHSEVPPASPLPFAEAIRQLPGQYIRVLTRPGAATFAAEQGKAAWNIIWAQIIAIAILSTLFGLFLFNVTLPAEMSTTSTLPNQSQVVDTLRSFSLPFALGFLILTPLSFLLATGIYHLIAKAFGGRGTFVVYVYSYLLYSTPLSIVSIVLAMIPVVGSYLSLPISIYQLVLQIFMTMAVHRLSGGRATLAVLLPIIVALVLICVVAIIAIVALVAAFRSQ